VHWLGSSALISNKYGDFLVFKVQDMAKFIKKISKIPLLDSPALFFLSPGCENLPEKKNIDPDCWVGTSGSGCSYPEPTRSRPSIVNRWNWNLGFRVVGWA
jgi:hypothetical protein